MGVKPTILPFIVLGAGLTGVTVAVLMQWWMNSVDYPLQISGKPMWSLPANVPIIFELMVLFSGVTAFLSVFGLNKLPLFYNPVFSSARFRRVTDDRFFIWIDRRDAKFSEQASVQLLQSTGAAHVEVVEENFYA